MSRASPALPALPSHLRRAALLWAALLGTGCTGSLLPKPAPTPTRYTLGETPAATADLPGATVAQAGPAATPGDGAGRVFRPAARPSSAPAGATGIVVALPQAAPGFDSPRMVYLRQPQVLQAYAYAEWVDTPARLLLPMMVQALERTGAFHAVLQAPSSAAGALRLETELLRLQHDHTQSPSVVRLTLRTVLLESATRVVLATREFDARVPAPSDSPAGGAAAAATAARQVLAALAAHVAGYAAGLGAGTRREP